MTATSIRRLETKVPKRPPPILGCPRVDLWEWLSDECFENILLVGHISERDLRAIRLEYAIKCGTTIFQRKRWESNSN